MVGSIFVCLQALLCNTVAVFFGGDAVKEAPRLHRKVKCINILSPGSFRATFEEQSKVCTVWGNCGDDRGGFFVPEDTALIFSLSLSLYPVLKISL